MRLGARKGGGAGAVMAVRRMGGGEDFGLHFDDCSEREIGIQCQDRLVENRTSSQNLEV